MTARARRHGRAGPGASGIAVDGSSSHAPTIGAAGDGWMMVMGEVLGAAGAEVPGHAWAREDPRRTDRCAGIRRRLARLQGPGAGDRRAPGAVGLRAALRVVGGWSGTPGHVAASAGRWEPSASVRELATVIPDRHDGLRDGGRRSASVGVEVSTAPHQGPGTTRALAGVRCAGEGGIRDHGLERHLSARRRRPRQRRAGRHERPLAASPASIEAGAGRDAGAPEVGWIRPAAPAPRPARPTRGQPNAAPYLSPGRRPGPGLRAPRLHLYGLDCW